jgi:hypothetical protein
MELFIYSKRIPILHRESNHDVTRWSDLLENKEDVKETKIKMRSIIAKMSREDKKEGSRRRKGKNNEGKRRKEENRKKRKL